MSTAPRRFTRLDTKAPKADAAFVEAASALRDHEVYLIRELHHRLHAKVEGALRKRRVYLSFPLAAVLHLVAVQPGMSGAQLARRCSVTAQSMNGLLVALEKEGYIERLPDRDNARVLRAYAKPAGVTLMRKTMSLAFDLFDSMLKVFSHRDRAEFKRLLRALIDAVAVDDSQNKLNVLYPCRRKTTDDDVGSKRKRTAR